MVKCYISNFEWDHFPPTSCEYFYLFKSVRPLFQTLYYGTKAVCGFIYFFPRSLISLIILRHQSLAAKFIVFKKKKIFIMIDTNKFHLFTSFHVCNFSYIY